MFHLSDQQLDKNQPLFLLSDNAVLSNVFQVPFIKRNWNFFSDKKKEERFWKRSPVGNWICQNFDRVRPPLHTLVELLLRLLTSRCYLTHKKLLVEWFTIWNLLCSKFSSLTQNESKLGLSVFFALSNNLFHMYT